MITPIFFNRHVFYPLCIRQVLNEKKSLKDTSMTKQKKLIKREINRLFSNRKRYFFFFFKQ